MDRFPVLYTERLILRKLEVEDLPALVRYANNQKVADHVPNIPHPYREPDAAFRLSYVVQGFKNKTRYAFAIVKKENRELVGEVSLHFFDKGQAHAQLAYWVGEPFWNQGIATEAVGAILAFGFNKLALDLIYADCRSENKASEKVLLRSGLQHHGRNGNLILYKITKQAYGSKSTTG